MAERAGEKGHFENNVNTLKKISAGVGIGGYIAGLPALVALSLVVFGGSWYFERKLQQKK